MLVKNSGFTLIAIGMLAAVIGANTAVFSAVNAVLLKLLIVALPACWIPGASSDEGGSDGSVTV